MLHFPFAGDNMAFSQRKCLNHPGSFRHIWEEYTFIGQRKSISDLGKMAYLSYLKIKLGNQDKTCALHIVYKTYIEHLQWKEEMSEVWPS